MYVLSTKTLACCELQHGGLMASTCTSQPVCLNPSWSFHALSVLVWVLSEHSSFLPQSKHMHVSLIGDSTLTAGVSGSVNGLFPHLCDGLLTWAGCTLPLTP